MPDNLNLVCTDVSHPVGPAETRDTLIRKVLCFLCLSLTGPPLFDIVPLYLRSVVGNTSLFFVGSAVALCKYLIQRLINGCVGFVQQHEELQSQMELFGLQN